MSRCIIPSLFIRLLFWSCHQCVRWSFHKQKKKNPICPIAEKNQLLLSWIEQRLIFLCVVPTAEEMNTKTYLVNVELSRMESVLQTIFTHCKSIWWASDCLSVFGHCSKKPWGFSMRQELGCDVVNDLRQRWATSLLYAFPTFSSAPQDHTKDKKERNSGTLSDFLAEKAMALRSD